jgi:hypothetical protein
MGLERTLVGAARLQGHSTVGAAGLLPGRCGGPVSGNTGQGHILKHARAHTHPAAIKLQLHLAERGFWVRDTPLAHPTHNLRSHAMPDLLVDGTAHRLLLHSVNSWCHATTRRTFRHTRLVTRASV